MNQRLLFLGLWLMSVSAVYAMDKEQEQKSMERQCKEEHPLPVSNRQRMLDRAVIEITHIDDLAERMAIVRKYELQGLTLDEMFERNEQILREHARTTG
ncbi:MAG: hypothetical protein AB7F19_05550 [Candidatus Babeliales bacterium]